MSAQLDKIHIQLLHKEHMPHLVNLEEEIKTGLAKCLDTHVRIQRIDVIVEAKVSQENEKFSCRINIDSPDMNFYLDHAGSNFESLINEAIHLTIKAVHDQNHRYVDKKKHSPSQQDLVDVA